MKILKIELKATTDFHTTGDSQGSTLDYLRDNKDVPYIPGSHIKGVMRTEAERIVRSVQNIDCWITGDVEKKNASEENKRDIVLCDELKEGKYGCDVCPIFGVPNNDGKAGYSEGKIRIMDFRTAGKAGYAARMHASIDRDKLSKIDGGLFRTKVVPAGTIFTGHIIIKNLTESECRLLKASLHSMCHYGLGGNRSRGLGGFEICGGIQEISLDEYTRGGAQQ
ncbi:MAG: CRISPR-associated protein Csm3 [Methanolobus sp.]|jgi:CRISPR/Cas system CSM-associated protein Csm3 (group 7 of RAMP superfamily)|nr:CRISPR-associated protein Csm3 [Methanolobus sp.]MDK2911882.1 CRISPR-associated protein Csm3 [Methanolobus sp.]MDN5310561.1 CRISPR-associated protein Csm3 [Methanolobus sp.]